LAPQWPQKIFFFGFKERLDFYAAKTGQRPGADTLEPAILSAYEWSASLTAGDFMRALSHANMARGALSRFWDAHDVWLSPTTARVSEPWGPYNLAHHGVTAQNMTSKTWRDPVQFTIPHPIMGTPAISLPLAMHSSGMPIGVQIPALPAQEQVVLQLAHALELAMPWKSRLPALHVSRAL
jgi:amidase